LLGDRPRIAAVLGSQSYLALKHGDVRQAAALLRANLDFAQESKDRRTLLWCLAGLVGVALAEGRIVAAAHLVGAVERQRYVELLTGEDVAAYKHQVAVLRTQLDEASWNAAWEQGQAMTLDEAVAFALNEAMRSQM
jgi:non-specific serine/threonine protein kinase